MGGSRIVAPELIGEEHYRVARRVQEILQRHKDLQASPLADTIRSFDELCEGKWDHLPCQAFMYVGAIEEAAERAEKMEAA